MQMSPRVFMAFTVPGTTPGGRALSGKAPGCSRNDADSRPRPMDALRFAALRTQGYGNSVLRPILLIASVAAGLYIVGLCLFLPDPEEMRLDPSTFAFLVFLGMGCVLFLLALGVAAMVTLLFRKESEEATSKDQP